METQLQYQVNSYRFLDRPGKKMVRSWIRMEVLRGIPWTPLNKSLTESTVALVSSAGLALKTDQPFDQDGERENPWWGDPAIRVIPKTAAGSNISLYHLHMNPKIAARDLNTLLPLQPLLELERGGKVGRSADHHYSYMGYILQPRTLLEEYVPAMIQQMKQDQVNIVILVPG